MLIFDQVDGTLGRRQKALVDAHLEQCGHCRDYLEREQAMHHVFPAVLAERVNELTLSPAVRRNVISAVKPVEKKISPGIGIPRLAWALAAGLMLAVISASFYLSVGIRPQQFAGNRPVTNAQPLPAPEPSLMQATEETRLLLSYQEFEMKKECRAGLHDGDSGVFYSPMCMEDLDYGVETLYREDNQPGEVYDDEIEHGDNSDSTELNNRLGLA